jgi:hypothetical protein
MMISAQYLYQIPPIARSNICAILVSQSNQQSSQLLADEYLFGEIDRKKFLAGYHKATRDYGFFVINCNSVKDNSNLAEIYGCLKVPMANI